MAIGWLVAGQAQKYFLSFFLGSLEFAPGRDSEVLRTKKLYNLYFSPPATHPLTLHISSDREPLLPLIGNSLSTRQPSDCLPIHNLLNLKQSTQRDTSLEVKYSDLQTFEHPCCRQRPTGGCSLSQDQKKKPPKKPQHQIEILKKTLD